METVQTRADNQQRDVGTGNQQVVSTGETGIGNIVNIVTEVGSGLVQEFASRKKESEADRIVKSAIARADAAIAGQSDLSELDPVSQLDILSGGEPSVQAVTSSSNKLQRAVNKGTISREHARLLVSNSVVKAIEEQPFLSRQIRQAASNLLGFDPKSEGVRQFFQSFDTKEELEAQSRASQGRQTPLQKTLERVSAYITDPREALEEARKLIRLEDQSKALSQEVELGDMTSEKLFNNVMSISRQDSTRSIMVALTDASRAGVDLDNPKELELLLETQRNASWEAIQQTLLSNPNGAPSVSQRSLFRTEHDATFDRLAKQVKDLGPKALLDTKVEALSAMSTVFAHETLPQLKFLNDQFPRVAEEVYGTLIAGAGTPKQNALIAAQPGLSPLLDLASSNPDEFRKKIFGTLVKLGKATDIKDLTPEDKQVADHIVKTVVPTLEPQDREKVLTSLNKAGLTASTTKSVQSRSPTASTDGEKKLLRDEWNNIQATQPKAIADKIKAKRSAVIPDRSLTVSLDPSGKRLIVTRNVTSPSAGIIRIEDGDSFPEISKINRMLEAAEKGWAAELNIPDVGAKAQELLGKINGVDIEAKRKRLEELRAKKEAAGK